MEQENSSHKHVILMAFGLPLMTTIIVMGSMYAGHLITSRSNVPTEVKVMPAEVPVSVNVPQQAPPTVQVSTPPATVEVKMPNSPAPTVTVNTPPAPPPNITVNAPPAQVTIVTQPAENKKERETAKLEGASRFVTPSTPAPEAKPAEAVPQSLEKPATAPAPAKDTSAAPLPAGTHGQAFDINQEPTLNTLYQYASKYVESYCHQRGLDPQAEATKWYHRWKSSVEQAISDSIDSSEQTYINRVVIAKRDYFTVNANPEQVVEACRILLRYRDGNLVPLKAMRDSMTSDNLKKTVAFLAAGVP